MAVRIITDSVSDIPKHLAEKYEIVVFPLTVNFSDASYLDGVEIDSNRFFKKLSESKVLPTTSQVTIGVFYEKFKALLLEDDVEYLGIFMSSKLSGTYSAALKAIEMVKTDRIQVIDSKYISFSMGQIVLVLAEMAKRGDGIEQLKEKADRMIKATESRYIVDTLEYLKKGGRLSSTEAFVGSLLNIKPILCMKDGELKPVGKARGRKKAVQSIMQWLEVDNIDLNNKYVSLYHAVDFEYLNVLKEKIVNKYPNAIIEMSEVGTVVGTHSGPGCIALSFINIDKDVI